MFKIKVPLTVHTLVHVHARARTRTETWILCSLISVLLAYMHIFICPTKTSIKPMSYFPVTCISIFYSVPQLHIHTQHKFACCCCFKYFHLENKRKNYSTLKFPISIVFMNVYHPVASMSCQQSATK